MSRSTHVYVVVLLAALLFGSGCAPSASPPAPAVGSAPSGTQAPASTPAAPSGDKQASSPEQSTDSGEPPSKLKVQTLDFGTAEAYRVLQQNFEGFLERDPLGFSIQSLYDWWNEAEQYVERARTWPDRLAAMTGFEVLAWTFPLVVLALFGAAFFLIRREIGELTHQLQARIHLPLSRWTTRLLRGLVLVLGRVSSVGVLLIASYFPVQAVFDSALWTRMLSQALWVLLAYHAVSSLISVLVNGRILALTGREGEQLERSGLAAARIGFAFVLVLELLQTAGPPGDLYYLTRFFLRCALVGLPLYAYTIRRAMLSLLPESLESRFYGVYRTFVERNFEGLMLVTAFLLAFRAAGFLRAANFILLRGYALLGIFLVVFLIDSGIRHLLRRRVDFLAPDEERDAVLEQTDRGRLSRRVQQLVSIAVGVGIALIALDLFLLLRPALIVLRTPFVAIGQAEISFLSIVNLGLIIFGTVLAVKLLRAILNSKIYPLLDVDVGIAYAVNTILKYIMALIAFFLGISALGVDLTAVTVVLASLGVGIGFGLQTLVENLISGFIILFGRSVQKGDYITVEGTYGQVDAVGARSVVIKTPDNYEMLIPSKEIVGGRIINWSYEDNSVRARLPVGVSYDADPPHVKEVLLEVCERHEHVLEDPAPSVRLESFGDSSVNFELLFFFDCRETTEKKVIGELNFEVWDALQEEDITIPFPQRDLHIKPDDVPERPELFRGREGAGDS